MCKEHGDDVRGHMSTMTSELITLIKQKVSGLEESAKPKRRRRRRGGRKKKVINTDSNISEKSKNKATKKRSKRQTKNKKKKVDRESDATKLEQGKVVAVNPRRTLYGGRRRSITTDELKESMVDRL